AADSLGARRATPLAVAAAQSDLVTSVLVDDEAIIAARTRLWDEHRLAVEHAAATALAGVSGTSDGANSADRGKTGSGSNAADTTGGYVPADGEKVCVVLCGANTDLGDLSRCRSFDFSEALMRPKMASATTTVMTTLTRNQAMENATLTTHHAMMMAMIAPMMLHTVLIFIPLAYAPAAARAMWPAPWTRSAASESAHLCASAERAGRPAPVGVAAPDRMIEGGGVRIR